MGKMRQKLAEAAALNQLLVEHYPVESKAFGNFVHKAESGKALSLQSKELINVALSVAAQCESCIAIHVNQAVKTGASRDEIVEAAFMAFMAVIMHGGPAYMYMSQLFEALDEFLPVQATDSAS
jgi:AhpD family alkylhydroperoxidase